MSQIYFNFGIFPSFVCLFVYTCSSTRRVPIASLISELFLFSLYKPPCPNRYFYLKNPKKYSKSTKLKRWSLNPFKSGKRLSRIHVIPLFLGDVGLKKVVLKFLLGTRNAIFGIQKWVLLTKVPIFGQLLNLVLFGPFLHCDRGGTQIWAQDRILTKVLMKTLVFCLSVLICFHF